jgi:hypothetical protein
LLIYTNNPTVIQRIDQLRSEGQTPDLMHHLVRDAQKWAEHRNILQDQVHDAEKFVTDYCRRCNGNQTREDRELLLIHQLEANISKRIDQLDQTVRDLLQIVSIVDCSLE